MVDTSPYYGFEEKKEKEPNMDINPLLAIIAVVVAIGIFISFCW